MRTGVDPGRDNIAGTADDGIMEVWSVPRTYPTFGQVNRLDDEHRAGRRRGQVLGLRGDGQQALRERLVVPRVLLDRSPRRPQQHPRNPNEAEYRAQSTNGSAGTTSRGTAADLPGRSSERHLELPWRHHVRVDVHRAAGRILPAHRPGAERARTRSSNVVVEGQAGRYDWVKLMDLRLSKTFRFGSHSFEGMFDVFNVTNSSVVLRRVTINGPNFMKPLATGGIDAASANPIPAPRIFRLSARWKF